ncbi:protein ARV 2-like [Apium graveolens]|uniref:protein ARV 2-like n=1 Tax=Apium graveolens TaxID=4045 RepID=UPI003D7A5D75
MGCENTLRCVHCGFPLKSLYIQYSPGNIRLMKCERCKKVADEYIECENMILVIDLILHKEKVYRHLFYNMFTRETLNFEVWLWKLAFSFLILDTYKIFVLSRIEDGLKSSMSFASLISCYAKLLMDVGFGNLMFLMMLFLGIRVLTRASVGTTSFKDALLAILVSSYFKIFLLSTMIWEFPSSVLYINDIVVLSSNTVALKVITESSMPRCLAVCLSAYAVKFLVMEMLNGALLIFGGIDWA